MRLSDVGEEQAVRLILREVLSRRWVCENLDPDDDAACVPSTSLVFKIDGYSITSSLLPWMSLRDLGWKAAVASMSDVVAKGGKPLALMVSVGLAAGRAVDDLRDVVEGVMEASLAHGALLVGGDTNSARGFDCEWIDVAVVGLAEIVIPTRPGVGDTVYTTVGRYGLTGAAVHAALNGLTPPRRAIEESSRPKLRLEFLELVKRVENCITASKDVSDGLAYTLLELARKAHASLVLETLPPVDSEVKTYAATNNVDLHELVLYGGEEYEIVFTVKPECTGMVESEARLLGLNVAKLGYFVEGNPRIVYHGRALTVKRWDQFKGYVAVANG